MASNGSVSVNAVLMDQRIRSERHKSNFETLKEENLKLRETNDGLKLEHQALMDSYQRMLRKAEETIIQLQNERDAKVLECENLRLQVLTPEKMDEIRQEVAGDIENIYQQEIEQLESDLTVLKREHSKLQQKLKLIKQEYEASQKSYESQAREMRTGQEAEVAYLKRQNQELVAKLDRDVPGEIVQLRKLRQENSQMHERLQRMSSENEELRAQCELVSSNMDRAQVGLRHELAKLKTSIESLTSEREMLREQVSTLQEELGSSHREQQCLIEQASNAQRQVATANRRLDEISHQHFQEMDDIKSKHQQHLMEIHQEKKKCMQESEANFTQCQALQAALDQMESTLLEKEREVKLSAENAAQSSWGKIMELEKIKMELEEQLAAARRSLSSQRHEHEQGMKGIQEQLTALKSSKIGLSSEIDSVRNELQQKTFLCEQLKKDVEILREMQKKKKSLERDNNQLNGEKQVLLESEERLQVQLEAMEQQLAAVQLEHTRLQEVHLLELERMRSEWEEERATWQEKFSKTAAHIQSNREKLLRARTANKKLQKKYQQSVCEQQQLREVTQCKEKQLSLEKEAIKKALENEVTGLKRQFRSYKRQHGQFMMLLSTSPDVLSYSKFTEGPLAPVQEQEDI